MLTGEEISMIENLLPDIYFLFMISGGPITCKTKKQSSVALSTAEAEYMALASSSQEVVWLSSEISFEFTKPVIIYEDNHAIAMTKNPHFHGWTKHIAIKYHYIREPSHYFI